MVNDDMHDIHLCTTAPQHLSLWTKFIAPDWVRVKQKKYMESVRESYFVDEYRHWYHTATGVPSSTANANPLEAFHNGICGTIKNRMRGSTTNVLTKTLPELVAVKGAKLSGKIIIMPTDVHAGMLEV